MKSDGNLVDDYLAITNQLREKYGLKTLLMMQIGSFYEVYDNVREGSVQLNVCEHILNWKIADTKKKCDGKTAYQCGAQVDTDMFDRSIRLLLQHGYTVAIMSQKDYESVNDFSTNTKARVLDRIYSPGCNLMDDLPTPVLICGLIHRAGDVYQVTCAKLDSALGTVQYTSSTHESEIHAVRAFGDFLYEVQGCTELIVYHSDVKTPMYFRDIVSQHFVNLLNHAHDYMFEGNFQRRALKELYTSFNTVGDNIFVRLEVDNVHPDVRACLIFLLRFARDHDSNLIRGIDRPVAYTHTASTHVLCINSVLEKIDMLTPKCGVASLLRTQKTRMGERLLQQYLRTPTTDKSLLMWRYDLIDFFCGFDKDIGGYLREICDMERVYRKMQLQRCTGNDLFRMRQSIRHVIALRDVLNTDLVTLDDISKLNTFTDFIDSKFECLKEATLSVRVDACADMQLWSKRIRVIEGLVNRIVEFFERVFGAVKGNGRSADGLVHVAQTNGGVRSIQLTLRRGKALEAQLKRYNNDYKQEAELKLNNIVFVYSLKHATIHGEFDVLFEEWQELCEKFDQRERVCFREWSYSASKLFQPNNVSLYVAQIDVASSVAKECQKHGYVRPRFSDASGAVCATALRHPLIERIVLAEGKDYVSNNVHLNSESCWLLYGVNSVGKSSLLKSILINVLLAQSGFFVAADDFEIDPFRVVGCRIGNADDLYTGQSSYIKETTEMDVILNKTRRSPSLIITDEMCSSTESASAIKVVASFVHLLSERRVTFACATHLFELQENRYIQGLHNVENVHLEVECDYSRLIFKRRLQRGLPVQRTYGIQVAKLMVHDSRFRQILDSSWHDAPLAIDTQVSVSTYNRHSVRLACEICGYGPRSVTDARLHTHHIKFQCTADAFDQVQRGQHKHNLSNLVTVCQPCHVAIHKGEIIVHGYADTTDGTILQYDRI